MQPSTDAQQTWKDTAVYRKPSALSPEVNRFIAWGYRPHEVTDQAVLKAAFLKREAQRKAMTA